MQTGSILQFIRQATALAVVALATGVSAWLFLAGLEFATSLWQTNSEWFFAAPVVGALTVWVYSKLPAQCSRGTDFIVALLRSKASKQQIHSPVSEVPQVLAPIIVVFTWLSHLSGLSVGREGTAVQMGGGIGASVARLFSRGPHDQTEITFATTLLRAGVAAGFGAVFGVPLAGAVFALEVAHRKQPATLVGSLREEFRFLAEGSEAAGSWMRMWFSFAILALVSFAADSVALSLGATHFHGVRIDRDAWLEILSSARGWLGVVSLIPALALAAWGFLEASSRFRKIWHRVPASQLVKIVAAGFLLSSIFYFIPEADRYAGLGVRLISASFEGEARVYDSILKILFTAICVGVGFKGGEVTPLLAAGAGLGAILDSVILVSGAQPLASIGMVGVFAVAARVPLACAMMAGELFGVWTGLVAIPILVCASVFVRRPRLYNEI